MNKSRSILSAILCSALPFSALAQEEKCKEEGYQFTVVKELPITSVKNQNRSSTCWSFSAISLLESEIMRETKKSVDLSEMFIVSKAYADKAEKFVRMRGNLNFSPGSSFGDVIHVMKHNGIVPDSIMRGLNYGTAKHTHNELDAVTKAYVNAVMKNPNGVYSTAWQNGFKGILDAYLGEAPEKFVVDGKEYTPISYLKSLGIDMDDYVSLTSFTHHPYYSQFIIEVPDNWRNDLSYNLPLDELIQVMDNSIKKGYTIAWASDISEKGFTRNGLGVVPDANISEMSGSDQAKWIGLSEKEQSKKLYNFDKPGYEKVITAELRQEEFDNGKTTDDHGMHIYGIAKDQNGAKYYMIKNSWGEAGKYKGFWYVSEPFIKYKTTNIVVNKNSIPKAIREKLKIK